MPNQEGGSPAPLPRTGGAPTRTVCNLPWRRDGVNRLLPDLVGHDPGAIVLDINIAGRTGFTALKRLKASVRTSTIPTGQSCGPAQPSSADHIRFHVDRTVSSAAHSSRDVADFHRKTMGMARRWRGPRVALLSVTLTGNHGCRHSDR